MRFVSTEFYHRPAGGPPAPPWAEAV